MTELGLNGFKDAEEYYNKASSKQFIPGIRIKTLLINAKDDPFLHSDCFPVVEARRSRYFYLEMPSYGGHMGFAGRSSDGVYWHEKRILEFFKS